MSKSRPSGITTTFIINTPAEQSIEENRKTIRSHVMRGKNRKKLPPRPPSWINGKQLQDLNRIRNAPTVPLTTISGEISPAVFETIWKLKDAMQPVELNLVSDRTRDSWLEPICSDAACLHFTIFVATVYQDSIRGQRETNVTALAHFVKALGLLQERLASCEYKLSTSDPTILVVVGFTMVSTAMDDLGAASRHIKGLHRMVTLRGGISAFFEDKQLQTKILRADLSVALATGHRPLFFSKDIPWDSYISSRRKTLISRGSTLDVATPLLEIRHLLGDLDTRLRSVWDDVSEVVRAANVAMQCGLAMDGELYQETMVSIHYRLVNLCFDTDNADEVIRLALLALYSSIFLQWRGTKTRYKYLTQRLKQVLFQSTETIPVHLLIWVYIIYAVSSFDRGDQVWLHSSLAQVLQRTNLRSWSGIRAMLKSIVWLDAVHDSLAKCLIERIMELAS
ncbi:hypothetical protein F5Y00DRAFT_274033 [Daldinia vernicosa]|uniref:uncharacterized protein n=1 Tax=Daldinia vernicosa TaxID=114800 RepID=UPI0020085588|nr:uncharacterized protein F5Y00DRAFT_274033 [Daldinia vernicosa]KAI0844415.1 hypothetical protein F5Y00DRAFT_274033 [Daldinia vernicosa]